MWQQAEAAIARGEQSAPQQRRADAMALPRLLHADRGLGLARKAQPERPQFGGATHCVADEKAVHDGVERTGQIDVTVDEIVGDGTSEAVAPAFGIKPQNVLAVFGSLANPQLADHGAFGKNFLHSRVS